MTDKPPTTNPLVDALIARDAAHAKASGAIAAWAARHADLIDVNDHP